MEALSIRTNSDPNYYTEPRPVNEFYLENFLLSNEIRKLKLDSEPDPKSFFVEELDGTLCRLLIGSRKNKNPSFKQVLNHERIKIILNGAAYQISGFTETLYQNFSLYRLKFQGFTKSDGTQRMRNFESIQEGYFLISHREAEFLESKYHAHCISTSRAYTGITKICRVATNAFYVPHKSRVDLTKNQPTEKSESDTKTKTITKTKEEKKMTTAKTTKEKTVSGTVQMARRAATHGAKVAAVDEIGETLLTFARELTGYDFTDKGDPVKNEIAKMVMATLLHAATENFDVPYGDGVAAACEMQIEASSRDVIQPRLQQLRPLFENLAKLGGAAVSNKK